MPQDLFQTLLGRAKPDPNMQPQFTPEEQGVRGPLDAASDFVSGLTYSPTEPIPKNVGKGYGIGALIGNALPLAAGMSVLKDEKALEPFMVELYKRRLQAEPWLATHPGLSQVPEFQEAFQQLYPNKKIITAGMEKPSTTKVLNAAPMPPAAASPEEAMAVAPLKAGEKPPRTALSGWKLDTRRMSSATLTEDGVRRIRSMASSGTSPKDIAKEMGMSQRAIEQLLNRESWGWVK
jgi:hypothetical protein